MDEQDRTAGTSGAGERHRPDSHGGRRGTPEASGARGNPPDIGRSAGLQRAAPCKNCGPHPAEGYAIEKVIFESLPGFFVTANLYRPNQPGRYPAVLFQSGHTQEGKPEPQRAAANLALKGFVVLCFDPIGQGEREQTYDPQLKAPAAGWSVNEHIHAGAQSILVGESVSRYFIWDAKRALDYLLSRPEVDAARVGAVGCSGGGALDRKSTRLNSSHSQISYAVFCLKKKKKKEQSDDTD